ncbi:MAG: ATP-binding protein [Candidatus Thiosymbion ectosymbiont of Robbea hypermnestra]|nr:ATP-binding protein [Candidatus Thiosymbion ectosymbiont of Robbea hypermnestra]
MAKLRKKERTAIIDSLRAGVVPRIGQQHIQVGRAEEVAALLRNIETVADGGAAMRFIIGEYGSGKTFFLRLIYAIAHEKRLVTAHADLNPDRRLHATGGQARGLYAELMRNLATRSNPEGNALASVAERFITTSLQQATAQGITPEEAIQARMAPLTELVGGYDFAQVVEAYWRGHDSGNERLKTDAVRWMRAEYTTKTDARKALGVRVIIDDDSVYDHLKLMARFVRLAGFEGLLIGYDELVNLHRLANTKARRSNYEQILRILNDCHQGQAEGLGILMSGTPEFLTDTRRGLYSYEALATRLAENPFTAGGLKDHSGPVIRLESLTPEDLYILLTKLRHLIAMEDQGAYLISDEGLHAFLTHCSEVIGDAYFRTPRNTIRAFLDLLAVLEQNPEADWRELLGQVAVEPDSEPVYGEDEGPVTGTLDAEDELTSFRL